MSDLKNQLFKYSEGVLEHSSRIRKVAVVGVGCVGMASAFSLMTQGICEKLVLIDVVEDRVKGEVYDLQHCQQFLPRCNVSGGSNYEETANSDIVVVTAGARQRDGESRLDLVQKNVEIYKGIIPKIVENSPNCILVIVSNPVDLMTSVALKLSGFPKNRVIGSGTLLDSARFRYFLGEKLNLHPSSVHGYIIGEHGDTSVAVWSAVNVGGQMLQKINSNIGKKDEDSENWVSCHKDVIDSAYKVIKLKGYTSWAIGTAVASLCRSIFTDERIVIPLSVPANGLYGINKDVHLSVLVVIGRTGVSEIVQLELSDHEKTVLQISADILSLILHGIKW